MKSEQTQNLSADLTNRHAGYTLTAFPNTSECKYGTPTYRRDVHYLLVYEEVV